MLVTAVMVTGLPERRKIAKVALNCFLDQTVQDCELLVVNHGESLGWEHDRVREVLVERGPVGQLRNIGLEYAKGEYIITWDDDDWHHPTRIQAQLDGIGGKYTASVLDKYTVLDLQKNQVFARHCHSFECGGCCGLIMHRRGDRRYQALPRREDAEFAKLFDGELTVIHEEPTLYLRTFYGGNLSSRQQAVMHPRQRHKWKLSTEQKLMATAVMQQYRRLLGME